VLSGERVDEADLVALTLPVPDLDADVEAEWVPAPDGGAETEVEPVLDLVALGESVGVFVALGERDGVPLARERYASYAPVASFFVGADFADLRG
jgi:hypothetical protein